MTRLDRFNVTIMLRFEKKTLLKTLKSSDCHESIRKQNRPSCTKIFRPSFCVYLVSWKQRNLEIRANIQIAFKMFWQKVASLVNVIFTITAGILARSLANFYCQ